MTTPLFAWPGKSLRETAPLCALFALLFLLLYGGASWWTSRLGPLPDWTLGFERSVPFVPEASLVYLTITPALLLAPFVFRTRDELLPLFGTLTAELLVGTVCFLLVPRGAMWTRPAVEGWIAIPYTLADTMNLSHNEFPSLHVAFAATAALAYSRGRAAWIRVSWIGWSVAIALSAWLMWEHNLVDIASGFALAVLAMHFVYRALEEEAAREMIRAEWIAIAQCLHFARRHVRYLVIFAVIWGASLRRWREYRAVRTGFSAAQWIDDLLDGDRASMREPLEIVDELIVQIESRRFDGEPLSRLTRAFVMELERIGPSHVNDFVALLREMRRDRERVLTRAVWDRESLDAHHRVTFSLSVNLMLAAARCDARAEDVPALIDALAWCSVFRDLDEDLEAGIINIPAEIVQGGDLAGLRSSAQFGAWRRESASSASRSLADAASQIGALRDARARRILEMFRRSIGKYVARERIWSAGLQPRSLHR